MKQSLPKLTAIALAVALSATAIAVQAQARNSGTIAGSPTATKSAAVETGEKAKASFLVGFQMAAQMHPLMREEVDSESVARGLKAALAGQKPPMSEEEAKATMQSFMAKVQAKAKTLFEEASAKNKAEGEAFLAKNKAAPGVQTTQSGLQYQIISDGTGPRPGPSDTVQINYVGTFVNGQQFDASKEGTPASVPLGNVIPGFKEGLQLMKTGAHYKLFIPSNLGYGAEPQGPMPPNATLVFDVTLVKTGPTAAAAESGAAGKK